MADAMVTSGMKDAGYVYLIIDDCWQIDRDGCRFRPKSLPPSARATAGTSSLTSGNHCPGGINSLDASGGSVSCKDEG
jgi:alpha-galactosidase